MPIPKRWISPKEAAEMMSIRAGYQISQDDIKQLRHRGKIKNAQKINERIFLYDVNEIRTVTPPKKRNPIPVSKEQEKLAWNWCYSLDLLSDIGYNDCSEEELNTGRAKIMTETKLDTILFVLQAFGCTHSLQQVSFYMLQEVIEGLTGHYSSLRAGCIHQGMDSRIHGKRGQITLTNTKHLHWFNSGGALYSLWSCRAFVASWHAQCTRLHDALWQKRPWLVWWDDLG